MLYLEHNTFFVPGGKNFWKILIIVDLYTVFDVVLPLKDKTKNNIIKIFEGISEEF